MDHSLISGSNKNLEFDDKYTLDLDETFHIAHQFYREKFGKAVHLSYDENLKLIAFAQQAKYGPLATAKVKPLGVFDVVGKARQKAWATLGDMSEQQAKRSFINTLFELVPSFKPYIEAVQKDRREKSKEIHEIVDEKLRLENKNEEEMEKYNEELQLRELQDALNEQTYEQFKEHVDKMHPSNPEAQAVLMRQLQEEHYNQYLLHMQSQIFDVQASGGDEETATGTSTTRNVADDSAQMSDGRDRSDTESELDESATILTPPSMWTRPDIKKFKDEVTEGKSGMIRVSHGDVVTVRVPTNKDGISLFWEFATDNYDIGFGVYFEWGRPENQEVTVCISDSDSEDDYLDDTDNEIACDVEAGGTISEAHTPLTAAHRNLSVVVPVYRRDCHLEVYAGSHAFPGEGTYLLKFDNSFSLWRSKVLYYRVFYTR